VPPRTGFVTGACDRFPAATRPAGIPQPQVSGRQGLEGAFAWRYVRCPEPGLVTELLAGLGEWRLAVYGGGMMFLAARARIPVWSLGVDPAECVAGGSHRCRKNSGNVASLSEERNECTGAS
jgi:hypothetical protein